MFLLLGTNLGDRKNNLVFARNGIELSVGQIVKASSLYQTAAWGKIDQPEFFNQALEVETALAAERVLQEILHIEQNLGRKRNEKWGERIIDIDILLYGKENINTGPLTIPHPQLANRRFALEPLAEIAGSEIHPLLNIKIQEMLERCKDPLTVYKIPN